MRDEDIVESLARLEHEQWSAWTNHFFTEQKPANIQKWRRQARTDYDDLTEPEKELDRVWARKVLKLFEK